MVVFLKCIWELPEQKVDAKLAKVADEVLVTQAENTTYRGEDGIEVRVDGDAFERSKKKGLSGVGIWGKYVARTWGDKPLSGDPRNPLHRRAR
jgi:hypothetical protein